MWWRHQQGESIPYQALDDTLDFSFSDTGVLLFLFIY
jgi:hypothetical protein